MSINKFRIKKKSDGSFFNPKVWHIIEYRPIWWLPIWKDWKRNFQCPKDVKDWETYMQFETVDDADKFINEVYNVDNRIYDVTIKSVTVVYN